MRALQVDRLQRRRDLADGCKGLSRPSQWSSSGLLGYNIHLPFLSEQPLNDIHGYQRRSIISLFSLSAGLPGYWNY